MGTPATLEQAVKPRPDSEERWPAVASAPLPGRAAWAARSLGERLAVLRRVRALLAGRQVEILAALAHLPRTPADSLAAELLPFLAACQFLEREASFVLRAREPEGDRPFWLGGVHSIVERVPLGTVLVIGPANYPLFLPGVQALQALAAGNAVHWKPGRGGWAVAQVVAEALADAGLPDDVLRVTDESVEAGERLLSAGVDLVVFTGSSEAGRAVQRAAAERATPVIAELSGCDAVFVLPGADPARLVDALAFGMRLNGSATCMAPRRLVLVGDGHGGGHGALVSVLRERFAAMDAVSLSPATLLLLRELVEDAAAGGATVVGDLRGDSVRPVLVLDAHPSMRVARADVFAPVLSVLHFRTEAEALRAERECPFGLTAAIFGPEQEARRFSAGLAVGTVLINDLIVPTADPRVPFGGRRASGFGVTRGAEGLLAMTAPRTVLVRRGRDRRHYESTAETHRALFSGVVTGSHAGTWRQRIQGWIQVVHAVRAMGNKRQDGSGA